ncbi:MAG: hypothetical protein FJW31_13200 [Acidobacteria bacterium]|nr:hypothetical protein [Acidobacteriota bacterium]
MTSLAVWLGTLILYLPTPDGAYVSADSRHDGGDPAHRDEARKIFLCGRPAVCAISGGLRFEAASESGKGTLNLAGMLKEASAKLLATDAKEPVPPAVLTAEVRAALESGIVDFWEQHVTGRRVVTPLSLRLGAPSVATILIAARDAGGAMALAQMQFPFSERRLADGTWQHELRPPVLRWQDAARPLAQGCGDCMRVAPDHAREVATREDTLATLNNLYARAQEVEFCRNIIGGEVDLAVVEPDGGARWLRRKRTPADKPQN